MNWPLYLIQVNIYLTLFYAFYVVVLQNETFFKWNRIFLVGSGALSFLIPVFQSEWVKSMFVTKEIESVSQVIAVSPGLALSEVQIRPTGADDSFTFTEWIAIAYFAGALFFLGRFIWQLSRVNRSFNEGTRAQSFFKRIEVSADLPSRESIVKHEEVHTSQLHSADVIFFEVISIINWFNPAVYAYKKSAKYIHEFIADEVAAAEDGKSDYALLLVSSVFGVQKEQLTNNFFNQSLLKKRIMMLHKTKSRKTALLKYGLSAPLFAAMVIFSSAAVSNDDLKELKVIAPVLEAVSKARGPHADAPNLPAPVEENDADFTAVVSDITEAGKSLLQKVTSEDPLDEIEAGTTTTGDTSSLYSASVVDVMPEYPGGIGAFYKWVGQNYKYPKAALEAGVSGKIIVTFVVEKDGSLTDIKRVGKGLGFGTGQEAIRVLQTSKKWKPGIQKGRPVRVQYTLPIMLSIPVQKPLNDSAISIRIRQNGANGLGNPSLIIIDGKPVSDEVLSKVNSFTSTGKGVEESLNIKPTDIKAISVLKGEQAAEQYGEKGKNGVIIITTKGYRGGAGQSDKVVIDTLRKH